MRLAIAGTILAFAITAASAQSTPQIVGTKAFCIKGTEKVDCSYDTMAACEKGMKDKTQDSTSAGSCISRSDAR